MKLISIIIPVYNHLSELKKTLSSINLQSYRNFEVIVVDDGSTQSVEGAINTKEYNFNIYFLRQENKGAPAARNAGFEMSKGDFVIFWDADVIATKSFLEKMMYALDKNQKAGYAYSNYYYGTKKMQTGEFDIMRLRQNNFIMTTSLMRRSDFPYFDESLKRFQDWDLWLTMLENGKQGVYIPEYLFFVIPHKNGISSWLPKIAYKKPWSYLPFFKRKVEAYENAKNIVMKKHQLYS